MELSQLVDNISKLTLLEASELEKALEDKHGVKEIGRASCRERV